MSLRPYRTCILRRHEDGTVTVEYADRIIAVARDLWDQIGAIHKRDDGTLWLDTAGQYRYQLIEQTAEALVFEQIEVER